jgi:hypothetical protein
MHLPDTALALELKALYYAHVSWIYNCIPQDQFIEEVREPSAHQR